ncbi:MAG: hypothetical protein ACRDIX_04860 [Actinomycetota bacterium]
MENELKKLLRRRADDFDMPPEPPRGLVRGVRRRRLLNGTLAGAAAAALVAGASIGIREAVLAQRRVEPAESPGPTATPSPEPTTEPTGTPEPVASPRAGAPPATFVAFQRLQGGDPLGRLVLVDTAEGQVIRVLLDHVDTSEGGIAMPELSPDGQTLYYEAGTSACTGDVLRMRLDGGEPEVLATAGAGRPALSPDGRLLAYLYWDPDPCIGKDQYVVVRDADTGEETRWRFRVGSSGAEPVSVRRLVWLSDSRTLAYELGHEEASSIYLLDTERDQSIELGRDRPLGPRDSSLELIGLHAEGVAAVRRCLIPSEPGCPPGPEIVALDPDTGEIVATLLRPAPEAFSYDLDPSGRHLLYIGEDGLYRWSGGEAVKIGDGYSAAAW